jgi:lipoprotein NlpI
MACGVKIFDVGGELVSTRQAVLREIVPLLWMPYVLYLQARNVLGGQLANRAYGDIVNTMLPLAFMWGAWGLLEVITMLTNKKRRAIHDFIAGTVVVREKPMKSLLPWLLALLALGWIVPELMVENNFHRGSERNSSSASASNDAQAQLSAADQAVACFYRASAWGNKKDYDRAIADYTEAIRLNPQYASAFYYRGNAWRYKDNFERAIADYNEAIRLNPQDVLAFRTRGSAWRSKGDYNRAIADFTDAIRLDPRDAVAFRSRGNTQFLQAKFSSAASDFAQSQQLKSDAYTALWLFLARARDGGDSKAELTLNTNGMDERKWPGPVIALYLGNITPAEVSSQAVDSDVIKYKEQLCEANFYLGQWHLLHGESQQARTLFTQAQNDCPKNFIEYSGAVAELERLNVELTSTSRVPR